MTAINSITDLTRSGEIAAVTLDSPPVNALSEAMREGLIAALAAASADNQAKAILLICAGRTFIAGADISEFGRAMTGATFKDLQDAMDAVRKPLIAAIHGTALGGGLEVALCAHYRIATASAKLGLPEVSLGLVPGAGGTQRLPRLVGVEKALNMITSGQPIGAQEAFDLGLIDAIAPTDDLKKAALDFVQTILASGGGMRRTRDRNEKIAAAMGHPEIFTQFRASHKFRGFEAPGEAIRCIEAAVNLPFDDGLALERAVFEVRKASPQSAAQRYAFFAERKAAKIPDVPGDAPTLSINKVGIIGAGTMGGGIAMNFANAGIPVVLVEQQAAALERGLGVVKKNYDASARRGRFSPEEAQRRFGLMTGTLALEDLADCDLIIEAVFERMDIKKDVFRKLDAIAKPGAILASNTSYLDLNEIAAATARPDHVLGLHFFSPANVMKLLEVVRGDKTAKPVVATAMKLAKRIGKVAVLVGVGPGFVGNRLLAQRTREAQKLVMEGAMPWDVDRVLTEFGLPMGPFQMGDLAGLDLGWVRAESKGESLRDRLNERDRRGQKTNAGYYDYDENRKAIPSPVTEKLIAELMLEKGVTPRRISDQEILERTLYPMINEAANILDEGKALRASDIDVIWLNGYGWPAHHGGPTYYADRIGLARVLAGVRKYGWTPAPLLEKLVAEGKSFADLSG
jgi:3-hydroxyacyl-CoA dehydrogenase